MIEKDEFTINDSQLRLEKMGIGQKLGEKLLSFKAGDGTPLYDSSFKTTAIYEESFIEQVKGSISGEAAKDVYQKAVIRRSFVTRYIENAREMTDPHYRALRVCNISHHTAEACDALIHQLQTAG